MRISAFNIFYDSKYSWSIQFYNIEQYSDSTSLFAIERNYDIVKIDFFFMDFLFILS